MGRGYSANRSKSGRLTVRRKRERSLSLAALKSSLKDESSTSKSVKNVGDTDALPSNKKVRSVSVVRRTRAPSDSENNRKSSSVAHRTRSVSLLSEKVRLLEKELEDEMEASEDETETVIKPDVMTKYKFAGRTVDEVLDVLSKACVVGANSKVLCDQGDEKIKELIQPFFSKSKSASGNRIVRGLSFPTTVSVNEVLCNHAPYTEEEGTVLRPHDVVKLHVGCHIDGYPVSAARTVVVKEDSDEETKENEEEGGKKLHSSVSEDAQRAIDAARIALLGMIHSLRPTTSNAEITDFVARVGHHFSAQPLEGVLSNRVKRWVPDGINCIIGRRVITSAPQQDVGECEIHENQVWTLDIAFTNSPNFRTFLSPEASTLFRRAPEDFLGDTRIKSAAIVLKEISENFFCFPFHSKHLSDPLSSRFGIRALAQQGVVEQLPVLRVKPPFITSRFSATVAVTSKKISILCGLPSASPVISTLSEGLQDVLSKPLQLTMAAAPRRDDDANSSSPKKKARSE